MKEEICFVDAEGFLLSIKLDGDSISVLKGTKKPSEFSTRGIIPQVPPLSEWTEQDGRKYSIGEIVLKFLEEI